MTCDGREDSGGCANGDPCLLMLLLALREAAATGPECALSKNLCGLLVGGCATEGGGVLVLFVVDRGAPV